ncbi:MAG: DUF533 domain-containing protein [Cereibacter sphaeroides]|uniref:DUF533 domain-containing protein n=1 Tax=Cereibacter sphaeroides TaxID=1063 RepID=A0A2W5UQI4_CERSP|nr:MAG: DUF533 domain-containing protein [Cereibacter sphaeroides]
MSFIKTLATLAIGFAAAKGYQKYQQGGMTGVKDSLRNAGEPGGMADSLGQMAEKMGLPGGAQAVRDTFAKVGGAMAQGTEAAEASMGSIAASVSGAAAAGSGTFADMIGSLTGNSVAHEENAKLMIRAMIQAAKADGKIDAQERAKIMEYVKDASPEELAFVEEEMAKPVDIAALVADTGDAVKAQVYASSLIAIKAGKAAEKAYLEQLGKALGLDAATLDGLHAKMTA